MLKRHFAKDWHFCRYCPACSGWTLLKMLLSLRRRHRSKADIFKQLEHKYDELFGLLLYFHDIWCLKNNPFWLLSQYTSYFVQKLDMTHINHNGCRGVNHECITKIWCCIAIRACPGMFLLCDYVVKSSPRNMCSVLNTLFTISLVTVCNRNGWAFADRSFLTFLVEPFFFLNFPLENEQAITFGKLLPDMCTSSKDCRKLM